MTIGPIILIGGLLVTGVWAITLIVLAVVRGRGWILTSGATICLLLAFLSAASFVSSLEPGVSTNWRIGAATLSLLMLGGAAAQTWGLLRGT